MRHIFGFLVLVLVAVAVAQPGEGGYVFKSTDGSYSQWSQEQALNSMADWYTARKADSVGCVVATRYGSHHRLKQIVNISGSTQKYLLHTLGTLDTFPLHLSAYQASGKLPAIKKVISGAVVDSTVYFFQYK